MFTLFIYSDFQALPRFALVEGDYSKFDNVIINAAGDEENAKLQAELTKFLFDDEGNDKLDWKDGFWEAFTDTVTVPMSGAKIVNIGFYP